MKKSVVTMIQKNDEQLEAQVLLRCTHSRVNNVHPLIVYFWSANHDSTGLINAAHSKRYCTKYVSKSSKHSEMYSKLLDELCKGQLRSERNNVKHVLIQIFLTSIAHRTCMSKHKIAYRVMQLPLVIKSYANVQVVSCYWRATLVRSPQNKDLWVYSDRTACAAYAERNEPTTVYNNFSDDEKAIVQLCTLKEFCETMRHEYKPKCNVDNTQLFKKT